MYRLNETKIKGRLKIRKDDQTISIERRKLKEALAREIEKEADEVRRYDYRILMDSVMGLESLLLEKKEIKVVFDERERWRGEGEAVISNNKMLLKVLNRVFEEGKKDF